MRISACLRAALLGISLSAVSIAVCRPAAASQAKPESQPELERSFAFMTKKWGSTIEELRDGYEASAPNFVVDAKGIIRRYSRNYIVGVLGPDQPDFHSITEFAHIPGGEETINASIRPVPKDRRDIARITTLHFTQRLVAGPPLVYEPGPVHKRGILLRRATEAGSAEIVATELSGFVENLARQLQASTHRVMLYVGASPRRNYQSAYYPTYTDLDRYMDAVVMLWPKEGSALPEAFEPPANFEVLTVLDFETYDSKIDLSVKYDPSKNKSPKGG